MKPSAKLSEILKNWENQSREYLFSWDVHNMPKKIIILSLFSLLLLSSCADKIDLTTVTTIEPVGFLYGIWHGMILLPAFIFSLFDHHIAIYAVYNNGHWYDFGFALGAGGTISLGHRSK